MARAYHVSAVETARALGVELRELEDWNCCGATAYFHIDELLAYTLCARNLAMAERTGLDLVAPCAGCFKNLHAATAHLRDDPDLADHINDALRSDDLHVTGTGRVRHLIEVFVEDVGIGTIRSRVRIPLTGLRVAPYYGCQVVRPQKAGEAAERVRFFEDLLEAVGATPVAFPARLRCCGGSLIATQRTTALALVHDVLASASALGAQLIATLCPLCQINLECYQPQARRAGPPLPAVPVLYFTQILGVALGIPPKRLGIGRELVRADRVLAACRRRPPEPATAA
jgi:heterodisulfide reductase subunit B